MPLVQAVAQSEVVYALWHNSLWGIIPSFINSPGHCSWLVCAGTISYFSVHIIAGICANNNLQTSCFRSSSNNTNGCGSGVSGCRDCQKDNNTFSGSQCPGACSYATLDLPVSCQPVSAAAVLLHQHCLITALSSRLILAHNTTIGVSDSCGSTSHSTFAQVA